jgi:hypothetical protein
MQTAAMFKDFAFFNINIASPIVATKTIPGQEKI